MGLVKNRQFAHVNLTAITTGARQTVIAADSSKERVIDKLIATIRNDASTTEYMFLYELSDTGAANHRPVGRSLSVPGANVLDIIQDMTGPVLTDTDNAADASTGNQTLLKELHIPAGAELTVIRVGGNGDADLDIVSSGREEVTN